MGLFSAVIHVRHVDLPALTTALDAVLEESGFARSSTTPLSGQAPEQAEDGMAAYACGPLRGDWCTVVQVHFFEAALDLSDVGLALSELLDTYVLSLDLHDDDVLYYNLDHRGEPLDGYDSDPMYFEQERLSEADIEARRHHPEAFAPLLPPGASLDALQTLLDHGWWHAHAKGELDEDGILSEAAYDADDFLDADARMAALGKLLQLHGSTGDYPYVAWTAAGADAWEGFTLMTYARA